MRLASRTSIAVLLATALCLGTPAAASALAPLYIYTPEPPPPPAPPIPPPAGRLEGPCGLAVDPAGSFYLSDYYHDAIDLFGPKAGYFEQRTNVDPGNGPCGLAVDSTSHLYVNEQHATVDRIFPFPSGAKTVIDPGPATGVATDPATDRLYVDDRDRVSVYEPSGAPVEVAGQPLRIGQGSLAKGYGIAVSRFPATAGYLYVPDAATETVKVYDPATDTEDPVATIDGHELPAAHFTSLRDGAVAVDDLTGEVYVADDLQPGSADRPEAAIYVFSAGGAYRGRLKYNIIDARPPGLAVDNSAETTQGRVYVTSGNTERSSVIAYPPGAAGGEAFPAPVPVEALPPGGCACGVLPDPPPPVTCEGDSCQHLPSEPSDPTLNTLVEGASNPPVHFHDTNRLAHYRRLRHHHHARGKRKHSSHRHGRKR